MAIIRNFNLPIRAISLALSDIKSIFERLSTIVSQHAVNVTAAWTKPADKTQEEFEKLRDDFKSGAFKVHILIKGSDGPKGNYAAVIEGEGVDLLSSPELPESIDTIVLTNIMAWSQKTGGNNPPDSFRLHFDFSKPPLIDGSTMPSSPTRNSSVLEISGNQQWVSSIKDAVEKTTSLRKNRRYSVHASMIYDAGLMLIAVPLALYCCWRLSGYVTATFGSMSEFLVAASYIYIVFCCLWIYRGMFGYLRWAFPLVELIDKSHAKKHRAFWFLIATIFVFPFARDVFKSLFFQ